MSNTVISCIILRQIEQFAADYGVESVLYEIKPYHHSVLFNSEVYYIRYHTIQLRDGTVIMTEQSDDDIHVTTVRVNGRVMKVEAFGEYLNLEPFLQTMDNLHERCA